MTQHKRIERDIAAYKALKAAKPVVQPVMDDTKAKEQKLFPKPMLHIIDTKGHSIFSRWFR